MVDVVIDQSGLVYHDPENLGSTIDMDTSTADDAAQNDVKPCSYCFPDRHSAYTRERDAEIAQLTVSYEADELSQANRTDKPWLDVLGWD